jgi:hypothetical protein
MPKADHAAPAAAPTATAQPAIGWPAERAAAHPSLDSTKFLSQCTLACPCSYCHSPHVHRCRRARDRPSLCRSLAALLIAHKPLELTRCPHLAEERAVAIVARAAGRQRRGGDDRPAPGLRGAARALAAHPVPFLLLLSTSQAERAEEQVRESTPSGQPQIGSSLFLAHFHHALQVHPRWQLSGQKGGDREAAGCPSLQIWAILRSMHARAVSCPPASSHTAFPSSSKQQL